MQASPAVNRLFLAARIKHREGNLQEAIALYRQALEQEPGSYKILNNLAAALEDTGRLDEAETNLREAIPLNPDEPSLHYNLGHVLHQRERYQEAINAYGRALELSPEDAAIHYNLGQALCASQQPTKAIVCFQAAARFGADTARTSRGMGDAYLALHLPSSALASFQQAVAAAPEDPATHFAIGTAHEVRGDDTAAALSFRRSLDLCHTSNPAFEHLARVLVLANRHAEARAVLEEWLQELPEQPVALHLLAALGGGSPPARASDEFVRTVFDAFATDFDQNLARLGYRAPPLLVKALTPLLPASPGQRSILDLGCGTGLVGPLLRPYAGTLTGVDLSARMLEKARLRQVYDHLVEAELTSFLAGAKDTYDVIIAADTLVYFGDLEKALAAARRVLSPGGLLAFTLEKADDPGHKGPYHLQPHGRYCHAPDYVRSVLHATGLIIQRLDDITPRKEAGKPVKGLLVLASRQDAATG